MIDKLENIRRDIYTSAIVKVQTFIRRWNIIRSVSKEKDRFRCVIILQKYIRQWNKRIWYLQAVEKNRKLHNLIVIQKYIRFYNSRKKLYALLIERHTQIQQQQQLKRKEELRKKYDTSAIIIQKYIRCWCAWRDYIDRYSQSTQQNQIKRKEELRKRYDTSAIVIQKYIRAWRERKDIIARVVERMLELKEFEIKKIQEVEEHRKILQDWNLKEQQRLKRLSRELEANNIAMLNKSGSTRPPVAQTNRPVAAGNEQSDSLDRIKNLIRTNPQKRNNEDESIESDKPPPTLSPDSSLLSPRIERPTEDILSPRGPKKAPEKTSPITQKTDTRTGLFKAPSQSKGISKIQGFLSQHASRNNTPRTNPSKVIPPNNNPPIPKQLTDLHHNHTSERKLRGRSRSVDSLPDFNTLSARK